MFYTVWKFDAFLSKMLIEDTECEPEGWWVLETRNTSFRCSHDSTITTPVKAALHTARRCLNVQFSSINFAKWLLTFLLAPANVKVMEINLSPL